MKKIIGILGVAAIAVALYFNVNSVNNNTDLAGLIAINTANAEMTVTINDCDDAELDDKCSNNGDWPGCDNSWIWDTCEVTVDM